MTSRKHMKTLAELITREIKRGYLGEARRSVVAENRYEGNAYRDGFITRWKQLTGHTDTETRQLYEAATASVDHREKLTWGQGELDAEEMQLVRAQA